MIFSELPVSWFQNKSVFLTRWSGWNAPVAVAYAYSIVPCWSCFRTRLADDFIHPCIHTSSCPQINTYRLTPFVQSIICKNWRPNGKLTTEVILAHSSVSSTVDKSLWQTVKLERLGCQDWIPRSEILEIIEVLQTRCCWIGNYKNHFDWILMHNVIFCHTLLQTG